MYRALNFKKGKLADRRVQFLLLAFVFLGIGILVQMMMQHLMREKVQISEALMDSGVVTSQSSIEMAGQYTTKSLTDEQKQAVIEKIADKIGLDVASDDLLWEDNEAVMQVSVHRQSKSADTKIQLVSVNVNEEGEIPVIQNYVMVHMEVYDQIDSIMNYKKLIQKCFDELEMSEESSYVQFIGTYPGALTLDSKNQITDQMIRSLNGHVTYENRADDLYTVYAYSGGIPEYISVGKSKVNIQVAMNYDEVNHKTMVYLATPIMNGSY